LRLRKEATTTTESAIRAEKGSISQVQEALVRENPNLGNWGSIPGQGLVSVKGKYMKDANSDYRLRSGKVNTQRPLSQSAKEVET